MDESFFSKSYCCTPGAGYFKNDVVTEPFDRWGIFENFRKDQDFDFKVSQKRIDDFFENQENWHLLDGYTEGGDPDGKKRPSSYAAYWNMIKNGETSGMVYYP